jgi:hypothetical protein
VASNDVTKLSEVDLLFLRDFIFLQQLRTDISVARRRRSEVDFTSAVFGNKIPEEWNLNLSDASLSKEAVETFKRRRQVLHDLKVCVLQNSTKENFVTSDDPAIFTNRFYFQKLHRSDFGLQNSGTILAMPLTPKLVVVCYDGGVYSVKSKIGHIAAISKSKDVRSLNELQYIRASKNIYFSRPEENSSIQEGFASAKSRRKAVWHKINFLIPVEGHEAEQIFRLASEEEAKNCKHSIINEAAIFPEPSSWCSVLRFRATPRYFSDGSMAGYVRDKKLLEPRI